MVGFLRTFARRVLSPATRQGLYASYTRYAQWWIQAMRPGRRAVIERMAAGQHIDFEEVQCLVAPPDGVVIDVGAETGEVTRFFLGLGFEVIALEPEHNNFRALSRIRSRKLTRLQVACADRAGAGFLEVRPGTYFHRLLADAADATAQPVKVVTLGEVIARCSVSKIAVLKIDVEGGEAAVLRGLFSQSKIVPEVLIAEFTRETIRELLELVEGRYEHLRFLCRWNEAEGQSSEIRLGIFDGAHPLVFEATWGNLVGSKRSFRILHPLRRETS